jgi:hypothetical protein
MSEKNTNMLWDILLEAEKDFIMKNGGQYSNAIKNQFSNITKNFYEHEKNSGSSLISLNKKLISVLVNEWVPMLKTQEKEVQEKEVQKKEIKTKQLVTSEDIKNSRKSKFEEDYSKKENEFKSAMAQPTPVPVDFSDKKDEPISEMEKLIAETISQRNLEINPIQSNKAEAEAWLKIEKPEKRIIKIGEPINPIELPQKKQLSWANNLEEDDSQTGSIFQKLKPAHQEDYVKRSEIQLLNSKIDSLTEKIDSLIKVCNKIDNR